MVLPKQAGVTSRAASDGRLVLAGTAACTAFDVVWILRKARQAVSDYVVDAEAKRAPAEPKVFTHIHLRYCVRGGRV